jgi:hypothetical protein
VHGPFDRRGNSVEAAKMTLKIGCAQPLAATWGATR